MSPRAAWRLESLGFTRVYDYVPGKTDWLAAGLPREGDAASIPLAGDVVEEVLTCYLHDRLADVQSRTARDRADRCVVVGDDGSVMGLLRPDRVDADDGVTVEQVMRPGPTTVRASEPLADLADRMKQAGVRTILVTTPEGRLIGLLHRDEAERVLERAGSGP